MGTTRIKVIDLSSDQKEIKTARKHAEKVAFKEHKKEADKKPEEVKVEAQEVSTESTAEQAPQSADKPLEATAPPKATTAVKKPKRQKHHLGKKYVQAKELVEDKIYTQQEAFELLPKTSITRFDPTVEIHLNVSDKSIKGNVSFPHLKAEKQKPKKYLIFADKQLDIKDQQIIWATDKTVGEIESSTLKPGKDFDVVIASAKYMPALAKVAKILGPKGMMPNPKNGTVTDNPEKIIDGSQDKDQTPFRSDPTSPVIHSKIGKLSQKETELKANLKALVSAIGANKIKGATLATTMGPGIRVDVTTA